MPWSGGSARGDLLLSRDPARGANLVSRQEKPEAEVSLGPEEREATALLFGLHAPNSEPRSPAVKRVPMGHSSMVPVIVVVQLRPGPCP